MLSTLAPLHLYITLVLTVDTYNPIEVRALRSVNTLLYLYALLP